MIVQVTSKGNKVIVRDKCLYVGKHQNLHNQHLLYGFPMNGKGTKSPNALLTRKGKFHCFKVRDCLTEPQFMFERPGSLNTRCPVIHNLFHIPCWRLKSSKGENIDRFYPPSFIL